MIGWGVTQQAFVEWFSVVRNEGQDIVSLQNIKHKKHESTKDYYNKFLWLCVMMPQPLDDVYLWETFQKGLHLKLKMKILKNC